MANTERRCKECPADTKRPAPHPGPRCATHHRARRSVVRVQAHERGIAKYGITRAEYDALKASQGGKCYVCQNATGATRNLAVDHDHALGFGRHSVRALLCKSCNYQVLGRLGPEALQRAIEVLTDPPAQKFLRELDRLRVEA